MMKRKLFFWLEQLKITRTERRAISMLLMILAGLVSVNAMVKPTSPFDNEYYSELEKEFQLRTRQLQQQEEQQQQQDQQQRYQLLYY
jgi:sensor histidine kinase YesM